jgi:hypothetical protein
MGEEDTQQAVWNFDGSELYLIFQIKSNIVFALENWDIIEAYKKIRLLRMELDAKLTRDKKKILEEFDDALEQSKNKNKSPIEKKEKKLTEKEEVDGMMKELDEAYTEYTENNILTPKKQSLMYQLIEKFYMHLCYLMKKHGLYFREGEDFRLAVLRR